MHTARDASTNYMNKTDEFGCNHFIVSSPDRRMKVSTHSEHRCFHQILRFPQKAKTKTREACTNSSESEGKVYGKLLMPLLFFFFRFSFVYRNHFGIDDSAAAELLSKLADRWV